MLGLFESVAMKARCYATSIEGALAQPICDMKNHIVEKQYERKHKQYQKNTVEADQKKSAEANALIDKTIKALSEDNLQEVNQILTYDLEAFKSAVAGASKEQMDALNTYMCKLDYLAGIVLSARAQAAQAIGQGGMPIFYPAGGNLAQQAAEQGGITAMDIIKNLQQGSPVDIQHANPQGINNPIPIQA